MEEERSALLGRAEAAEQAVRDMEAQRDALRAEAAAQASSPVREQLEQALGQLRVARSLRDTLQRDLEAERTRGRGLAEATAAAEARLPELEAAAQRDAEELERVRDAASTADFERQALQQQLEASSGREEALRAELEAVRAQADGTRSEAAAHATAAEAFERQLADAESQLSVLVAERAELAARADALSAEVESERAGRAAAEEAAGEPGNRPRTSPVGPRKWRFWPETPRRNWPAWRSSDGS